MIFQPHLLFADVYLLDVIDQLLLQPVGVVVLLPYLFFQQLGKTFPDLDLAEGFQPDDLFLVLEDIIDAQDEVFFQGGAFVEPVGIKVIDGGATTPSGG